MSGIGSHSCGPALSRKYRLEEKDIQFNFTMKPASGGGPQQNSHHLYAGCDSRIPNYFPHSVGAGQFF
jgi:hypothetical protein